MLPMGLTVRRVPCTPSHLRGVHTANPVGALAGPRPSTRILAGHSLGDREGAAPGEARGPALGFAFTGTLHRKLAVLRQEERSDF